MLRDLAAFGGQGGCLLGTETVSRGRMAGIEAVVTVVKSTRCAWLSVYERLRTGRDVDLVAGEEEGQVRGCEGAGVIQKSGQGFESRVRAEIIDQDCACGATVVGTRNGAEALSACCVPELELDSFSAGACANFYYLAGELDANCLGAEDAP